MAIKTYSYQELKPVLLETEDPKVKEPYITVDSPTDGNLTIISSGRNGSEYNKTFGSVHTYPGVVSVHCLYGHGILMTQRFSPEGDVKEVQVHQLRPGKAIEVPSQTAYCIYNTGRHFLVAFDNFATKQRHSDETLIRQYKGLCYYVVERKGEIAFDKNPNYSFHPQLVME